VSLTITLAIGLIGGLGALARFSLDGVVAGRAGRSFPYGTLAVNLTGALILGALAGATIDADAFRVAGTGLIGSFTTFSTWMLETHRLGEDDQPRAGLANLIVSLTLGIAAVWIGRELGAAL
jgi:CrcB protein